MNFEKIAVIGERELALGFKLIGVKDVFMEEGREAVSMFERLLGSKDYNLIMLSENLKQLMDPNLLRLAETSLKPIVIFIPVPGSGAAQESVETLAKRVLGVDIQSLKGA
jgi:V/A-type H+-transporting ATPase subunit F